MSKKKHRSGHYCKICSEYKSNESFSGMGHANHICKKCSKKSPTEQDAEVDYSNGTIQKTSGTHVYLPEKVEELYWGFREFFAPAYPEKEECEEDMELQGGIDDLPF